MSVPDLPAALIPLPSLAVNEQAAAAMLGVSPRTMYAWRTAGIGPKYRRVGGRLLYARAELERWLAAGDAGATAAAKPPAEGGAA